ncbi:heavy metal-associated isoprenylated plant protein 42 [Ziziphus jujuba]|uniref:Heavy metal-associated isoprenylated plant protein 42 n=1 Tax=Ziziphus jujuba TaxID=326968 RepID=A0A6P6GFN3_ZIZJJ|nr:heavy metal-associated isoprenylated plant protein 42 [Ziziphus jujuba]
MDNHLLSTHTCTLKMNLLCCEECPKKLKKKLQKINGVKKVNIDRQQGLVAVSGNIDPVILREKIIILGKRAELLSFQKHPITSHNKSASSSKSCSCGGNENTTTSDEDDNDQNTPTTNQKNNGLLTWQRPELVTKDERKKKTKKVLPMPGLIPRPIMNYMGFMPFHGPFRPLNMIHRPPVQAPYANGYGPYGYYQPIPWAPAYSYFGSRSPSRVNPMIHSTSYEDNYSPL